MKKFLVTADDYICRDGQYVNFNELAEQGKVEVDKGSSDPEWYDFEGEFVLDTCVVAASQKEALEKISGDYEIPAQYLKAYELV